MNTLASSHTSIWRSPTFLTLFTSAFLVTFAAKIYDLALPLLVFELTQSAKIMGWMRAVEFLPNLLLAAFIGVWVDGVSKKRWSQAMLMVQLMAVCSGYLAVEYLSQPLWVLFPAAFIMMAANYGYHNARLVMMKQALPNTLQNTATARMSALYSMMETVGPILSGVLLLLSAIHNTFLLVALMMGIAFWQISRLELNEKPSVSSDSMIDRLKQGWDCLVADKIMVTITFAVMMANTTGSVFWIQALYFAKAELSLSSLEVSYLVAGAGIGGLLGAFSADKVRLRLGLGKLFIASLLLESVGFLFPVFFDGVFALVLAFTWVSAVGLYSSICVWSYRQEAFDTEYIGRIAGITGSLFKLTMPFGLAASGYLVDEFGSYWVFTACFAIQALVALSLVTTPLRLTR